MSEQSATPLTTIISWFKQGLVPTEAQFKAMLSSFHHKLGRISADQIDQLEEILREKADDERLNNFINQINDLKADKATLNELSAVVTSNSQKFVSVANGRVPYDDESSLPPFDANIDPDKGGVDFVARVHNSANPVTPTTGNGIYIYDYDNSVWKKIEGLLGEISESNVDKGVSGADVVKELIKINQVFKSIGVTSRKIPFTLDNGSINPSNGSVDDSLNWINSGELLVIPGENYTIHTPRIGSAWSLTTSKRVVFKNESGSVISVLDSGENEVFSFVVPLGASLMIIQIDAGSNVGANLSESSIYNEVFKIYEGGSVDRKINTSLIKDRIESFQILDIEKFVNELKNSSSVTHTIKSLALGVGALAKNNSVVINSSYKRTSITNLSSMCKYTEGDIVKYTGEIEDDAYAGVLYFDNNGTFLGFEIGEIGVYNRELLSPPSSTRYIGTCSFGSDPIIEIESVRFETKPKRIIHVNGDVALTGDGSVIQPFKTITEAINNCSVNTDNLIVIRKGDYRETLDLKNKGDIFIQFKGFIGEKVRVLGSQKLEGWALHSGNVYRANFSGQIYNYSRYDYPIFENGNHSKAILEEERHPLQKGLSYRLPFSVITPVNNVTEVEANEGSYYYDDTNGVIYLHASSSSNPTNNGFSYEIPNKAINTYNDSQALHSTSLNFTSIQFLYATRGLTIRGFDRVERYNCSAFGMAGIGGFVDDSFSYLQTWYDEAGGNDNDGINGHFNAYNGFENLTDHRTMQPSAIYNDFWLHDNLDDGMSHHENHNVAINGGRSEYNKDGGIRVSNDANYVIRNYSGYKNGLTIGGNGGGEGIGAVNQTINPNRRGCTVRAYNCVLEANNNGVGILSQSSNYIELIDCTVRNNKIDLYANKGTIISRNTKQSNSAQGIPKLVEDGGEIVIINDNLLT